MPNPIEDRVFEYVLQRRPLKLIAVTLTVAALLKTGYEGVVPAGKWTWQQISKVLPLKPDATELPKLSCAVSLPQLESLTRNLTLEYKNATSNKGTDFDVALFHGAQVQITRCFAVLGFGEGSSFVDLQVAKESPSQAIDVAYTATSRQLGKFEGYLSRNDPAMASLLIYSSLLEAMNEEIIRCRTLKCGFYSAETDTERRAQFTKLTVAHKNFQDLYPYRLPTPKFDTTNSIQFEKDYRDHQFLLHVALGLATPGAAPSEIKYRIQSAGSAPK